jgi:intein-encoded DNA endonuclease-like protein
MIYDKNRIIQLYNSGLSCLEIAKNINSSRAIIERILKQADVKIRTRKDYCKFNKHYLDSLDSEEKAYFLGFMFADGYNQQDARQARLVLQSRDIKILDRFSELLKHKNKPKINSVGQYGLSFCSQHFSNRLASLGCIQNKSLKLRFPDLEPDLIRHFVRGYFDGDGCLYHNLKSNQIMIAIISTESFCISLQEICLKFLDIKPQKLANHPNNPITKIFRITGKHKISKFLTWIYDKSSICLDRKFNKYLTLQSHLSYKNHRKVD